ncbi:MAG: triose-phosphate isomerase [Alphaproteobacteria bacterium]|nr:triose-phosphate isomerase [Alphaproteobacteria bacterium]
MNQRKKLVVGNWKMNGNKASLAEAQTMAAGAASVSPFADLAICPPATLAGWLADTLKDTGVALGGQNCHTEARGAFTGDISAEMWADLGARYVIVGHSERREYHGETDAIVAAKAAAAARAGLEAIICVGESLGQRDAGEALQVVGGQLAASIPDAIAAKPFVVAYEPVWAIGTGRTPTAAQVAEMHAAIRDGLRARIGKAAETCKVLYGGSVKPENARELMHVENVDGALVGGASLKAADFLAIAQACS